MARIKIETTKIIEVDGLRRETKELSQETIETYIQNQRQRLKSLQDRDPQTKNTKAQIAETEQSIKDLVELSDAKFDAEQGAGK